MTIVIVAVLSVAILGGVGFVNLVVGGLEQNDRRMLAGAGLCVCAILLAGFWIGKALS